MNDSRYRFPLAIGGGFFLIYALTLAAGMTAGSLPLTAKIAGWDWLPRTNAAQADKVLSGVLARHPDDLATAEKIFRAYLALGDATNALRLIQSRLEKNPDDIAALNNEGVLLVETRRAAEALPVLERTLAITNAPSIRLNRAIAEVQLQKLDEAKKIIRNWKMNRWTSSACISASQKSPAHGWRC